VWFSTPFNCWWSLLVVLRWGVVSTVIVFCPTVITFSLFDPIWKTTFIDGDWFSLPCPVTFSCLIRSLFTLPPVSSPRCVRCSFVVVRFDRWPLYDHAFVDPFPRNAIYLAPAWQVRCRCAWCLGDSICSAGGVCCSMPLRYAVVPWWASFVYVPLFSPVLDHCCCSLPTRSPSLLHMLMRTAMSLRSLFVVCVGYTLPVITRLCVTFQSHYAVGTQFCWRIPDHVDRSVPVVGDCCLMQSHSTVRRYGVVRWRWWVVLPFRSTRRYFHYFGALVVWAWCSLPIVVLLIRWFGDPGTSRFVVRCSGTGDVTAILICCCWCSPRYDVTMLPTLPFNSIAVMFVVVDVAWVICLVVWCLWSNFGGDVTIFGGVVTRPIHLFTISLMGHCGRPFPPVFRWAFGELCRWHSVFCLAWCRDYDGYSIPENSVDMAFPTVFHPRCLPFICGGVMTTSFVVGDCSCLLLIFAFRCILSLAVFSTFPCRACRICPIAGVVRPFDLAVIPRYCRPFDDPIFVTYRWCCVWSRGGISIRRWQVVFIWCWWHSMLMRCCCCRWYIPDCWCRCHSICCCSPFSRSSIASTTFNPT